MKSRRIAQRSYWRIAVVLLAVMPGLAAAVEDAESVWTLFSASDKISADGKETRWRYWFDATARWLEPGSGAHQVAWRPAVGYDLSDKVTVWAGYGWSRTESAAGAVAEQRRYWQQLSWPAGRFGKGRVSLRLRLEQRELDIASDWRHILRLQAKYTYPLGEDSSKKWILSLEPYFDLNESDWGGDTGMSQHRTFLGIGLPLSPDWSIELGYLNQYIFAESATDRMIHVGLLHLRYRP